MKHFFLPISVALLLLSSCTGGVTRANSAPDSTAVADSDSLAPRVLTSVFGNIPDIYEGEMLAITEKARQEVGNDAEKMRGVMANLADSAYEVAEDKSLHEIVAMQNGLVPCTAEKGLPFTVEPQAHVLTVLLPKLKNLNGEQRVFVQMEVTADSIATKAYYVLRGKEGNVSVGTMNLPISTQKQKATAVIVAPNAPAKYLAACSEIHFISKDEYQTLRQLVRERQKTWRAEYAKEIGLEIKKD